MRFANDSRASILCMFRKKVNFTWTSLYIRIYFHLRAFFFHHWAFSLTFYTVYFLDEVFAATFLWMHSSRTCHEPFHFFWFSLPWFLQCSLLQLHLILALLEGLSSFSMLVELAMLSLLSFLPDLPWKNCQFPCFGFFAGMVVYGLI